RLPIHLRPELVGWAGDHLRGGAQALQADPRSLDHALRPTVSFVGLLIVRTLVAPCAHGFVAAGLQSQGLEQTLDLLLPRPALLGEPLQRGQCVPEPLVLALERLAPLVNSADRRGEVSDRPERA